MTTSYRPGGGVAVAGDWHGDLTWAQHVFATLAAQQVSTLLHLGDFGIWPERGHTFVSKIDRLASTHDIDVLVTPGNHEWWPRILDHPVEDRGDGLGEVAWFGKRVAVLPRGHRFDLQVGDARRSVVSLGGAPSVDFDLRREGRDWWPEEAITEEHVARAAEQGAADIMLTHDAPGAPYQVDSVRRICTAPDNPWSARALSYAAEGSALLTTAFLAVRPRMLLHGHYHCRGSRTVALPDGGACRIVALDQSRQTSNVVLLNLVAMLPVEVDGL